MQNIWLTADSHFGHKKICEYSNRPFSSVEEMDEILIQNWNNCVKSGDLVYHIGDIFLCPPDKALSIRRRLNGSILLTKGNHDGTADRIPDQFVWIKDYYRLKVNDVDAYNSIQEVILFHYALRVWDKSHHGAYSAYSEAYNIDPSSEETFNAWGHSHGSLSDDPYSLSCDVGVDGIARRLVSDLEGKRPETWRQQDYRPFSYEEFKTVVKAKVNNWKPVDHHTGKG